MSLIKIIKKFGCIFLYLLFAGSTVIFAQTVSSKKDIAVFRLSYPSRMPTDIAAQLDQRITAIITSFKRFNVIGMQYRLKATDTAVFIQKIKEAKAEMSDLPDTVLSGEEAFTRTDWEQLTGAFLVFAPQIGVYNESIIYEEVITQEGKRIVKPYWEIKIEGALSIIDVSGTMGQRTIPFSTDHIATLREHAIDNAVESIADSIYTAIKFESDFALTSGIIDFDRRTNTVTMELGRDMGIHEGDEYYLQKTIFTGGRPSAINTGFCIISEVHDTFSVAKIIYANQPVITGDAVKEAPAAHFAVQGYAGITVPITGVQPSKANDYLQVQPTFGIKYTYRSSFHISVSAGYEYAIQQPLNQSETAAQKPLKLSPFGILYLGLGVYNFYTARFKITPELQFCYSGTHVYAQQSGKEGYRNGFATTASHIGGRALLSADYFITQGWTFGASAGIGYAYATTGTQQTVQRLRNSGFLSAQDARRVNDYEWNILRSHLQFYCFLGITGRL